MSVGIIVKNYEHYNRALGKYITSKKHYEHEMAKGGFVTFEEGEKLARQAQNNNHKDYRGLSKEAESLIKAARMSADSKGNVKPSDRLIDGMKKVGINFDTKWCPKHYRENGGFDATNE